jgi:enamine deaminase RidA (YjgF/YER057c/UK114 family)
MSRRFRTHREGFAPANPVPVASRIGPHLYSGVLTGRDPVTREMPEGLEAQCANVFAHVRELMAVAGGSLDDIVKLTFHVVHYRDREALNREWERAFPDPDDRPARQVMAAALDGGALVHCDLVAILQHPSPEEHPPNNIRP